MLTWFDFGVSSLLLTLMLYLPAVVFVPLFGGLPFSLAISPVVTVFALNAISIAVRLSGNSCSFKTVGVPFIVAVIFCLLLVVLINRKHEKEFDKRRMVGEASALALYLGISILVCALVLVKNLCGASSFSQLHDNVQHLNLIRSFAESGQWSSFESSAYMAVQDAVFKPVETTGFYPSAWNTLAAFLCSLSGITNSAFIENVLNVVLSCIVFPVSMCSLIETLFSDSKGYGWILTAGAIITPAFAAFPWGFYFNGPLYPNILGMALLPACLSVFLRLIERVELGFRPIIQSLFILILSLAGLAVLGISHPNTLFSALAIIAPAIYRFVYGRVTKATNRDTRIMRLVFLAFATLSFLGIWLVFYKLPFLQFMVHMTHNWLHTMPLPESSLRLITMEFIDYPAQPLLSVLTVAGLLQLLRDEKSKDSRWIVVSALICASIYLVSTLPEPNEFKHFVSGFWYTDHHRTSAVCVIPFICLSSFGLGSLLDAVAGMVSESRMKVGERGYVEPLVGLLLVSALAAGSAITNEGSAWRYVSKRIDNENNSAVNHVFSYDEQLFTEEVVELIGEDVLVINYPYDGSMFAYSVYGMRTLYRLDRNYQWSTETPDSRLIREHLSEIATNPEVQEAVNRTGASYVVLFDQGDDVSGTRVEWPDGDIDWDGIIAINETTPGFELVLHEGDMYLYRIETTWE